MNVQRKYSCHGAATDVPFLKSGPIKAPSPTFFKAWVV
jgi:hypothetical protein